MEEQQAINEFHLLSPAFRSGDKIPLRYTCKGQNVNPPLNILHVPQGAKSLALIMHDPDAVGQDFVHWLVWDISPSTETIAANSVPVGAIQGLNSAGQNGYMGPCPPPGTGAHRYMFELYALDTNLSLSPGSDRQKLQETMKEHTLDQNILTGLFSGD